MKTIELTERECTILYCLVRMEEINRQQENWRMDKKTERFTDEEITKYDSNSHVIRELSALEDKLKD